MIAVHRLRPVRSFNSRLTQLAWPGSMASTVRAARWRPSHDGDGRPSSRLQKHGLPMLRSVRWRGARHVHVVPATAYRVPTCLCGSGNRSTAGSLERSGRWTDSDDNNNHDDLFLRGRRFYQSSTRDIPKFI